MSAHQRRHQAMRQIIPALLALTVLARYGSSADEGNAVRIGDTKAETPKDWIKENPRNEFRAYQFRLPGPKGNAELLIFDQFGGTAKQNVDRWKKQFTPPTGKTLEDVAKVTEMKVGGYPALYLDISGTYDS